MGLYEHVLLPTDGSAGMARIIEHAGELARIHEATVHALYVIDATTFTGLPMQTSHEGLRTVLRSEGETALEQVERLLADVPVETHTVEGSPSAEIVRWTRDHEVDVVVMGTHGRGGLDRLLLGSVAERVVRKSHVPVITVRVGDRADEAHPEHEHEHEHDRDQEASNDDAAEPDAPSDLAGDPDVEADEGVRSSTPADES